MTIVPMKVSLIGGAAALASVGVLLTLVHRPATAATAYHADTSKSADITPTLASLGTPQISVNGVGVPANPGTTNVATPAGTATVTVSGGNTTVSTDNGNVTQTTNTPSGDVHIQVKTSSNGNGNASSNSFQQVTSNSSVNSSTDSNTSVSTSGSSQVDIQTN
jgi:hypothetical protein